MSDERAEQYQVDEEQQAAFGFGLDVLLEREPYYDEQLAEQSVRVKTNVPHTWRHHSPAGFEWGYAGSGPAELALNILVQFTDRVTSYRLHQLFKEDYVAPMPPEGGRISAEEIHGWIARRRSEATR